MRSLDQIRAARAYAAIPPDPQDSEAKRTALKLPAMLQINGLLATWAYLLAKSDQGTEKVLGAMVQHFRELAMVRGDALAAPRSEDALYVFKSWLGGRELTQEPVSGPKLRELTGEALAFSVWLKRAAEAAGDGSMTPQQGNVDVQ